MTPFPRRVFLLSHTRFVLARGVLGDFLIGVCRPVLQILTLLQTKKSHFPDPFSDQTSKIHYYHHYLDYSANNKIFQIHFEFTNFYLFLIRLELKR